MKNEDCLDLFNLIFNSKYKEEEDLCWIKEIVNDFSLLQQMIEEENKIDWLCISMYQNLSEDFIREFKDWVDWCYISKYQKLSESFRYEFKNALKY